MNSFERKLLLLAMPSMMWGALYHLFHIILGWKEYTGIIYFGSFTEHSFWYFIIVGLWMFIEFIYNFVIKTI